MVINPIFLNMRIDREGSGRCYVKQDVDEGANQIAARKKTFKTEHLRRAKIAERKRDFREGALHNNMNLVDSRR